MGTEPQNWQALVAADKGHTQQAASKSVRGSSFLSKVRAADISYCMWIYSVLLVFICVTFLVMSISLSLSRGTDELILRTVDSASTQMGVFFAGRTMDFIFNSLGSKPMDYHHYTGATSLFGFVIASLGLLRGKDGKR